MFAVFGIHSLRIQDKEDGKEIKDKGSHSIFFTTFLLLTIAKLGDKTQLTVVALSSASLPITHHPSPITVWIGQHVHWLFLLY
ncbi:MAG: TMEM165/GDT1 family protein [Methylococcaceae bacterium]